jgi:hypothetical protein
VKSWYAFLIVEKNETNQKSKKEGQVLYARFTGRGLAWCCRGFDKRVGRGLDKSR